MLLENEKMAGLDSRTRAFPLASETYSGAQATLRVLGIHRLLPLQNPTDTTLLTWQVTFSRPVTGLTAAHFRLRKTGFRMAGDEAMPVAAYPLFQFQWNTHEGFRPVGGGGN